jgi:hypothetical protein
MKQIEELMSVDILRFIRADHSNANESVNRRKDQSVDTELKFLVYENGRRIFDLEEGEDEVNPR